MAALFEVLIYAIIFNTCIHNAVVEIDCPSSGDCSCSSISNGDTCNLLCNTGGHECRGNIYCEDGVPCIVDCTATSSCKGASIYCGDSTSCTINCVGAYSCQSSPRIYCGSADCILNCNGSGSCHSAKVNIESSTASFSCNGDNCDSLPSPFSSSPTTSPSNQPTVNVQSRDPTSSPSKIPTISPTNNPSEYPTDTPSTNQSAAPSAAPSNILSFSPSRSPSSNPFAAPSINPSISPSETSSVSMQPTTYQSVDIHTSSEMTSTVPMHGLSTMEPTMQPTIYPVTDAHTSTNLPIIILPISHESSDESLDGEIVESSDELGSIASNSNATNSSSSSSSALKTEYLIYIIVSCCAAIFCLSVIVWRRNRSIRETTQMKKATHVQMNSHSECDLENIAPQTPGYQDDNLYSTRGNDMITKDPFNNIGQTEGDENDEEQNNIISDHDSDSNDLMYGTPQNTKTKGLDGYQETNVEIEVAIDGYEETA